MKKVVAIPKLYEKKEEVIIPKRYCKRCGKEMVIDKLGYYACWGMDCFKKFL